MQMENVNENYSFYGKTKLVALAKIEFLEMKAFNISDLFSKMLEFTLIYIVLQSF